MQTTAYIALGANLGDRAANLRDALARLDGSPSTQVTCVSSFLENGAVGGPADSPPFLNAAAEVHTSLSPHDLLDQLLQIERAMGRKRREKWGPRIIDLDLLLYGDQVMDSPTLKVPHPLMHERDFVLTPLAEIAPNVLHPVLGRTIGELATALVRWDTGNPPGDRSGQRLTLRPATNADAPDIRDIVFSVLREYGLQPDPCSTDADLFDVEGAYILRGGRFDVLVDESGTVRGTVGLYRADGSTCELRKMYLHRSARGLGWGRQLLEHALAEARRLGFKRMTLETATPLKEAISLYTGYGFRPYRPQHMVPRCDQAYELWL